MTLVCVRLDESYSMPRLTALADSRASVRRTDGTFRTVSDTTQKLFAIPIRCYDGSSVTPVIGAWRNPYFESQIGLGFSGSCFEALTIVAHVTNFVSTLFAPGEDQPSPVKDGLVHLIARLTESYFKAYQGTNSPEVWMVIFGFETGRPWIGTVSWTITGLSFQVDWANAETLVCVGQSGIFEQYTRELRNRIQQHKAELQSKPTPDGDTKGAELSNHDLAEKKAVEEAMIRQIESDYVDGIGGVLQRLELGLDGDEVVAGFTQDNRPYLEGARYSVNDGSELVPAFFVERMGRKTRTPPEKTT